MHPNDTPKLCECGCGQPVPTPKFPSRQRRFINHHHQRPRPSADRFWEKVDKRGPDDCWLWQGAKQPGGYGSFWTGKKQDGAHRFSYELHNGPIPPDTDVCHSCDNPACVNPAHLWLGSRTDNMQDCSRKGRAKSGIHIGADNVNAKLTEAQVREIRQRYTAGEIGPNLAREYGVSHQVIYAVIHRKTWTHVT